LSISKSDVQEIQKAILSRKQQEKQLFFKSLALFKQLTTKMMKSIVPLFSLVMKKRGAILFKEGDVVGNVYIIERGQFKIVKKSFLEKPSFDYHTDKIFANPL
jgi:hypothetical protein